MEVFCESDTSESCLGILNELDLLTICFFLL